MKPINALEFGSSDAENYRRRERKQFFNKIFLRTDAITKLQDPSTFFLIGEKGTGKTAYAVYMSSVPQPKSRYHHSFIRETEYNKFLSLKKEKHLSLSDYVDVWKVLLLLLFAKDLEDEASFKDHIFKYPKFKNLNDAINDFYQHAFSPEIITAMRFVENSEASVAVLSKYSPVEGSLSAKEVKSQDVESKKFQTNLLYIRKNLQDAISSLKLSKGLTIFIDGIDVRPSSIDYVEYLECVKGLANAVWSLNNDFFPSIKDSSGRLKIVLLLRPDIFNSIGLQNRNTKLKDNSVLLNWVTDYSYYRDSEIFQLADRLFSAQQTEALVPGAAWDHYFPFEASSITSTQHEKSSFIVLLRYSYHRPRDILTILSLLHEIYKESRQASESFTYNNLMNDKFKNRYGQYLLGEVKDSLSFYYDDSQYELFLKFFEFLNGAMRFDYEQYVNSFDEFTKFLSKQESVVPDVMRSADDFLQFLYDQNILNFVEDADGERFIRWCFRERTPSNISPKVKAGVEYEIHYGLANSLNTGKKLRKKKSAEKSNVVAATLTETKGVVVMCNSSKGFGFIKQDGIPIDIHFRVKDCSNPEFLRRGSLVQYSLVKNDKGGLSAKEIIVTRGDGKN